MKKITGNSVWLGIMQIGQFTGCHQMPERSFFLGKYQFPLCARCTGVVIGYILAVTAFCFFLTPLWACLPLCLIMLLDWLVQYLEIKESTNVRRLITGILGGYGLLSFKLTLITEIIIRFFR